MKQSSTELTCTPVKKADSNALEEPECLPLKPLIEYEEQDFDSKHVFWFTGSYSEFPHSSDVCAGAARMDHECEDSSSSSSCAGASGSIDSDGDERGLSDNEVGSVEGGDEEENLKKFVQDSILRLVEMK